MTYYIRWLVFIAPFMASCRVEHKSDMSYLVIRISTFQAIILLICIVFIIAIVWLYHKRKELERALNKTKESAILRTLIDNMPDFIYVKDTKSRFIIANKFLAEVTNVSDPEMMIGKTDFDYYPKEMAEKFFKDEQKIIKTQKPLINLEEEGLDQRKNKIVVSTTKVPWFDNDGNVLGIIGIGRNITKFKDFEKKLVDQARNLQEVNVLLEEKHEHINHQAEELAQQTENLKQLNIELHKINETKDRFISIIAHDLKNPFNAIINFSELLILKATSEIVPKYMEMIRIINSSSKMAYSLLENLLFWGKSQNASIPFRPNELNLSEIIRDVVEFHEVSSKLKNIMLINDTDPDLSVYADQDMVTAILRNLISNSIKFTPKNGEIRITSEVSNTYCMITVTDSGIGIPKTQLKNLFKPGKEIAKGTSGESGTGLGLILCKEFAIQNGGDISVKSEIRKGSSFILSLPLRAKF
jgi:PAS domain S-box